MKLEEHPTVQRYRAREGSEAAVEPLDAERLKALAIECGADDVGLVELGRPDLAEEKAAALGVFPAARTYLSLVCRLNPDNVRAIARGASDLEFHTGMEAVNAASHRLSINLRGMGVRVMNPPAGFPMELGNWPEQMWTLSHKLVAIQAGLGKLGHHRLLVHGRFGAFVVLGTMLLDREVSAVDQPLDFDPCLECKLCVAACPVGAIGKDGQFQFANCMTHNYRDRLAGFVDWAETLADSRGALDYRRRVGDAATVSMWQSLTCGVCNKSSYCMAVCPAGDDVVGQYVDDKAGFLRDVLKPLQGREETVYVLPGSDAEAHVRKRFPHKQVKRIGAGLRPRSIANFIEALPLTFQRGVAGDLDCTFHLIFSGDEEREATVVIRSGELRVDDGLVGEANVVVRADSRTWLQFLGKERGIVGALLTGKIRVKGPTARMKDFARCFPL